MLKTFFDIAVESCGLGRTIIAICLVAVFYIVTTITLVLAAKNLVIATKQLLKGDN